MMNRRQRILATLRSVFLMGFALGAQAAENDPNRFPALASKWIKSGSGALSTLTLRFEQKDRFVLSRDSSGDWVMEVQEGGPARPAPGLYSNPAASETSESLLQSLARASFGGPQGSSRGPGGLPSPLDPYFKLRLTALSDTLETGWRGHLHSPLLDSVLLRLETHKNGEWKDTIWNLMLSVRAERPRGRRLKARLDLRNGGRDPVRLALAAHGSIVLDYSMGNPPRPGITPLPPESRFAEGRLHKPLNLVLGSHGRKEIEVFFSLPADAGTPPAEGRIRQGILALQAATTQGGKTLSLKTTSLPFSF